MEFTPDSYPSIRKACETQQPISFYVNKSATCFKGGDAPVEWTPYPPVSLYREALAQIFASAGSDERGTLIKLELIVHLSGGVVLYKARGEHKVDLQINF